MLNHTRDAIFTETMIRTKASPTMSQHDNSCCQFKRMRIVAMAFIFADPMIGNARFHLKEENRRDSSTDRAVSEEDFAEL